MEKANDPPAQQKTRSEESDELCKEESPTHPGCPKDLPFLDYISYPEPTSSAHPPSCFSPNLCFGRAIVSLGLRPFVPLSSHFLGMPASLLLQTPGHIPTSTTQGLPKSPLVSQPGKCNREFPQRSNTGLAHTERSKYGSDTAVPPRRGGPGGRKVAAVSDSGLTHTYKVLLPGFF
ncbi:hypothetical protein MJT46_015427 [Ovis ammon polii x Ovis aries]|nr:hypothetical protein MJT46_015427 [Ovis ammon polii x Ovis aries]